MQIEAGMRLLDVYAPSSVLDCASFPVTSHRLAVFTYVLVKSGFPV